MRAGPSRAGATAFWASAAAFRAAYRPAHSSCTRRASSRPFRRRLLQDLERKNTFFVNDLRSYDCRKGAGCPARVYAWIHVRHALCSLETEFKWLKTARTSPNIIEMFDDVGDLLVSIVQERAGRYSLHPVVQRAHIHSPQCSERLHPCDVEGCAS